MITATCDEGVYDITAFSALKFLYLQTILHKITINYRIHANISHKYKHQLQDRSYLQSEVWWNISQFPPSF